MADTYLWIEDRKDKSGYTFWKTLMSQLCPNVIVESKKNNSELVKAVKALKDETNKYIIVYDNSFDNIQTYMERRRLKQCVDIKNNVSLMDIICFEYILLEFDNLIGWVFAPNDELFKKRQRVITARDKLVASIASGELDYKGIEEIIVYDDSLNKHNIEQLSAKMLFEITRNTGYEVSKGKIGDCWIKDCCEWSERQNNDKCGLDNNHLSLAEKMRSIFTGTSLKEEFAKVHLEVELC